MKRSNPLRVESLEDRTVPTLFGNPWPDPGHLTLSFVPDGTDVGGQPSDLFRTLDAQLPTATWQQAISRALQSWASQVNIDFNIVPDNGQPLGQPGPVQGNPRVGDLRISARPLSDDVIAIGNPFNLFSNWGGEIVFNSNKPFGEAAAADRYDVYTVALQETGHALGLDNSPDLDSAMYTHYSTARTGLAPSDVVEIRKLYGTRTADALDLAHANETYWSASELAFVSDATAQLAGTDGTSGSRPLVAAGDLTTASDVDYYSVRNPRYSTGFTVSLRTDGVSQLRAKVSVYDSTGRLLQSSLAVPPAPGQPFDLQFNGVKDDATYRVKVEAADASVFGVGGYKLAVGKEAHAAVMAAAPVLFTTSGGTISGRSETGGLLANNYFWSTTDLGTAGPSTDARWDFVGRAAIDYQLDSDFYTVRTGSDTPSVFVATTWATAGSQLDPTIDVFDSYFRRVPTEVLEDARGRYTVQFQNAQKNTSYHVRVRAADWTNPTTAKGDYQFAADFRTQAIQLTTFADVTLRGATNQAFISLDVTRSQSTYFDVTGTGSANAAVQMTVFDPNNQPVLTLTAIGGEMSGQAVLLNPGRYTVRFVAATRTGEALSTFGVRARYALVSDPIGPILLDPPSLPPTVPPPPPPPPPDEDGSGTFLILGLLNPPSVGSSTAQPIVWVSATLQPILFADPSTLFDDWW
ncbi:matrixin family metalloprotease [Limnoglobus roseus]|uniref:Peptidase metallopeptidase domain-containing protein n=1 Tax=Limnoglobus roseus TaxID=2598579 RepID=A0A5C1ALR8_9BACT|nr:matrixin family metalloprotease [Limnoglobus roseus]QEL19515.1 hypothetical protein PX52LOC_06590 [Limnoglobus roseus]